MTIKVVGAWELGWSTPIMEFDLWQFVARDFGVDELIMTPVSGIRARITEAEDIPAVIAANPDLTAVYVDEKGETELKDFSHPKDCLYVLGKASYSPWKAAGSPPDSSVYIKTPLGGGLLWPHQAIGMVLYDRQAKG